MCPVYRGVLISGCPEQGTSLHYVLPLCTSIHCTCIYIYPHIELTKWCPYFRDVLNEGFYRITWLKSRAWQTGAVTSGVQGEEGGREGTN